MRRRGPAPGVNGGDGELDAQYWAQAGAHGGENDLGGMDPNDQRFDDDDGYGESRFFLRRESSADRPPTA